MKAGYVITRRKSFSYYGHSLYYQYDGAKTYVELNKAGVLPWSIIME